jgi:acyl-CoA thioesterase-2
VGEALHSLLELLDLEEIERDIYRGQNEGTSRTRLFGGQVAAQALVAAGRTVEGDRRAHSLHAYFLRGGDPAIPVVYTVDRIRDGSSFNTRRVVAVQHGRAIFNMSASFHKDERGYEHADAMPDVPEPESLPTWEERIEQVADRIPEEHRTWMQGERPIDFRSEHGMSMLGGAGQSGPNRVWMRATGALPEDPFLHQCVAAYASDMSLLDSIVRRHVGDSRQRFNLIMASLDHAIWFHRPFRMDDWVLYVQESPAAAGARGFAHGTIFTRAGELVASVAQEGLIRPIKSP